MYGNTGYSPLALSQSASTKHYVGGDRNLKNRQLSNCYHYCVLTWSAIACHLQANTATPFWLILGGQWHTRSCSCMCVVCVCEAVRGWGSDWPSCIRQVGYWRETSVSPENIFSIDHLCSNCLDPPQRVSGWVGEWVGRWLQSSECVWPWTGKGEREARQARTEFITSFMYTVYINEGLKYIYVWGI